MTFWACACSAAKVCLVHSPSATPPQSSRGMPIERTRMAHTCRKVHVRHTQHTSTHSAHPLSQNTHTLSAQTHTLSAHTHTHSLSTHTHRGPQPQRDPGAEQQGDADREDQDGPHLQEGSCQGAGCRVQGAGCRVQGAGFRVQSSRGMPIESTRMAHTCSKVHVRLPGKGNANFHGARPVHLIIRIRTSRSTIEKPPSTC